MLINFLSVFVNNNHFDSKTYCQKQKCVYSPNPFAEGKSTKKEKFVGRKQAVFFLGCFCFSFERSQTQVKFALLTALQQSLSSKFLQPNLKKLL
jgi:hypothetical protein